MDLAESRRIRLTNLLDLAQNYRGWSRRELAHAIGRDPTKLVPTSGVPKIDFVADLARVLDWRIEDVIEAFWQESGAEAGGDQDDHGTGDFESLDQACREAHRSGKYARMVDLARAAYRVASTADERARARNREAGGWDGLGRFQDGIRAIQDGLRERGLTEDLRRMLQSNLANAYYTLWMPLEARAIADDLLAHYEAVSPVSLRDRRTRLFAHYVAGHSARRMLEDPPDARLAAEARDHLVKSRDGYRIMAEETGEASFLGVANTCEGGLIEIDAMTGAMSGERAVELFMEGIDVIAGGFDGVAGDMIESIAWWCIFGCNVALRSLSDEAQVQRAMAVFTNKADEIAEHLDSWPMRERVFTMGHMRWERASGVVGFEIPHVVDSDDVRVITGAMARFPAFRATGWAILRSAGILGEVETP